MIHIDKNININNTKINNFDLPKNNTENLNIFEVKPNNTKEKSTERKVINAGLAITSVLLLTELVFFKGKHIKQGFNFIKNKLNFNNKKIYNSEPVKYVTDAHKHAHSTNIIGDFNSEFTKEIDSKIRELPLIGKSTTVYRGIPQPQTYLSDGNPEFESLIASKVGDIIQPHKGFSFYAFDRRMAEQFASRVGEKGDIKILLKVNIPPEAKLSIGRNELVSPLGAIYKILEKHKLENNLLEILVDYIVK